MRACIDIRSLSRVAVLAALPLLFAFSDGGVVGEGGQICSSTRAANDLLSCQHCQTLKDLVTTANDGTIAVSVHAMHTGVLIEFKGKTSEDVASIQRLVDRLWEVGAEAATVSKYCKSCEVRHEKLMAALRDRALTETGAIVVVTTDDKEVLGWLLADAQSQGKLVSAASTR